MPIGPTIRRAFGPLEHDSMRQVSDDLHEPVKRMPLLDRLRRYISVGAICALTHNVIMIVADFLGVHYFPATLMSLAVVTPLGYFLHCRFTFREARSMGSFIRFAGGIAIGYPLSLALMALFCSGLGWPVVVAAPLTTIILFLFNYIWAHWAILRRLRLS